MIISIRELIKPVMLVCNLRAKNAQLKFVRRIGDHIVASD
jgi:hypothetical protein